MTVSSLLNKIAYTGNGATTVFAFPYPFIASSDLQVYVAGVLKTLTTDYTISGTAPYPTGANVTFLSAPANLASIVIIRTRPLTQLLDLVENDPLPAEQVELLLGDHLVMLAQQLNETLGRAITIPSTDVTGTTVALPAAASRANKTLGFDASGNVTVGAVSTAVISAAMLPVVQAATLAAGRAALGVSGNFTTEASVAAAATTDLGAQTSNIVVITGSTGITGFGNNASTANPLYFVRFTGAPLLTNSATLILPQGVNIQAAAGDTMQIKFEGASTWRVARYSVAAQKPVLSKSANYTVDISYRDALVKSDATSGAIVATAGSAVTLGAGFELTYVKTDSSANTVTITPSSGTIDGFVSLILRNQYERVTLRSDGTNWFRVSHTGKKTQFVSLTSGTSWSVPADVRSVRKVYVQGAGGGGAGAAAGNTSSGAAAGAFAEKNEYAVTPSGTVTYAIGALGAKGAAGANNGSAGGTTSFGTISAPGGTGGFTNGAATATSAATGGDINTAGWQQQGVETSTTSGVSGAGANSHYGAGGSPAAGAGGVATGFGAGGAGGTNNTAGGDGTAGVIYLEYMGGE